MAQYIIITIIRIAASIYIGYKIYDVFLNAGNPCHGCSGCSLHQQTKKHKLKNKNGMKCCKENNVLASSSTSQTT